MGWSLLSALGHGLGIRDAGVLCVVSLLELLSPDLVLLFSTAVLNVSSPAVLDTQRRKTAGQTSLAFAVRARCRDEAEPPP